MLFCWRCFLILKSKNSETCIITGGSCVMKKWFKVVTLAFLAIGLFGCSAPDKQSKRTVGIVISTLSNPFFVSLENGAKVAAKKEDYKLVVLDSNNDPVKELSNVQDLVTQGVKVIIINPTDSAAVVNAVKYANEHGVKVITIDRTSNGGNVITHIESDNIKGGEMAAHYLDDRLRGKGNIIELQGIPGASATKERGEGFDRVIAKTNLHIVAQQPANFNRTDGLNVTQNLLQAHPDVRAIFAQNDEMALGALKAVHAEGKHDILIVGFDGTKDGIQAVKDGKMAATVAQQPYLMGELAVETAVKAIAGKKISPNMTVPLRLVTKFNA